MQSLVVLSLVLVAGWSSAAPVGETLVITNKYFKDSHVIYTAKHDIVNIYVPISRNIFDELDELEENNATSVDNDHSYTLFFVEADIKQNGEKDYKGLYVYDNGNVKEILSNGRDIAMTKDKTIYFGATDGLYKYNAEEKKAVKYGTVTDSIVQLASDDTNGFCYLTTKHEVYCFTNAAEDKPSRKIEALRDVREMVIGNDGNLYVLNSKKEFFMFNQDGVKALKVPTATKVELVRSPYMIFDDGALALLDGELYVLLPQEAANDIGLKFEVTPTAYAPEASLIQFYALNKKLYEFNIVLMMLKNEFDTLEKIFDDNKEKIQKIVKSKNSSV